MPTALQLPYLREPAERKGRKLFRKQLLPVGEVHHPKHDKLEFSRERLTKLVEAFQGGAYDVVPFVLASEDTNHPHDPERIRGEVKGLELAADGLYGLIETDERGADLVNRHPNFPVSVRVVDPLDGRFGEALQHVSAAAESVVRGMKPWEAIEAASDAEVTDLSDGGAYSPAISTDADTKATDGLDFSAEEKSLLRKVLDKVKGEEKPDESKDKADEPSDEEVQRAVEQLLADASEEEEPETDPKKEEEPVAAAMSDEDRKTLEMAAEKTKRFELKAGKSELESKLSGYVKDGVPPAMVEAARDLLSGDETLVELANDREPSAAKKTFEALDKAKGTIEFSERGSSAGDDTDDESKQAKDLAKKMGEQFGKDGK